MIDTLQQYNKALVAIIAPIVIALVMKLFSLIGVEFTADISNAIVVLLTGVFVYLIPNKKV